MSGPFNAPWHKTASGDSFVFGRDIRDSCCKQFSTEHGRGSRSLLTGLC